MFNLKVEKIFFKLVTNVGIKSQKEILCKPKVAKKFMKSTNLILNNEF